MSYKVSIYRNLLGFLATRQGSAKKRESKDKALQHLKVDPFLKLKT